MIMMLRVTLVSRLVWWLVVIITVFATTTTTHVHASNSNNDLYSILGVTPTATTREIKSAYRRKALDTHPDKNKSVSAEQAAQAFHQVVQAFEVLSDPERREYYDATGRTDDEEQQQQQQQGYGGYQQQAYHWHFHWHNQGHYDHHHQTHLRDTWEAQNAQSRMMHITSLQQLRTLMLNDDDQPTLERHFLLCMVKPGQMEATALNDMVFPYPFAGMSEQDIWWEDILQTMYVSLTTEHQAPLAEFFGIDGNDPSWNEPIFIHGKVGTALENGAQFARIQTTDRDEMERFVWENLKAHIQFVNQHTHAVELFWMNEENPILAHENLAPGESVSFSSNLSQVWFARDVRVDDFKHAEERYYSFSDESVLMAFHILQESHVFTIPSRTCFDLATDCDEWAQYGECLRQPAQMKKLCPYSCDHCEEEEIVYHLYEGHEEL